MNKVHTYKYEKQRFHSGEANMWTVSAATVKTRNILTALLVFVMVFGLTFGFLFSGDTSHSSQVSASGAGYELSEAVKDDSRGYVAYRGEITSDGTVEIGSLADLLIASVYYSNSKVDGIDSSYIQVFSVQDASYTSFKLINNISGIFTAQDLLELDEAFPDGWGYGVQGTRALENVVKARAGDTVTILDSLFCDFAGTFDGNGYVIDGFNLVCGANGGNNVNAGFFATIAKGAVVKNVHLRNANVIADGVTYVGGLAGTALSDISNVSVHGIFNVANGRYLGGIVGALGEGRAAVALNKAIALGTMYAHSVDLVGGAIGSNTGNGNISNVVAMNYIMSTNGKLAGGVVAGGSVTEKCFYLKNSVWINKSNKNYLNTDGAMEVNDYSTMYARSVSGYGDNKYFMSSSSGFFDVLDDVKIDKMTYGDAESTPAPRESMRLCDIIDVFMLQYALVPTTITATDGKTYNVYTISASSRLVGEAKGTDNDPIILSNRQGLSLLRELRFATFKLTADVYMPASYKFEQCRGAFFGKIFNSRTGGNVYDEDGYHIYIKGYEKEMSMFEVVPFKELATGGATNVPAVAFPIIGY